MAIIIPLVSQFDNSGVSGAIKEFKNLEGAGAKSAFALKKAMLPAAAAVGAVGVALFDATKGAMEDEAAQRQLSVALKNNTGATDAQVKSTERWIESQGKLLGIADDDLRPAMQKLTQQTHDVAKAQELAKLAMDISASTGRDLGSVTTILAKAQGGQVSALAKLDPQMKSAIKDGMSLDDAMSALAMTFDGAAATAAGSAQGQMKRLSLAFSETKESIGAALLPAIEKLLPLLQSFASWAQDNSGVFLAIAGTIGGIAVAVMAANAAMTAWKAVTAITTAMNTALATSFTAIQVASGLIIFTALIAGIAILYAKFSWFREGVADIFSFIKTGVKGAIDGITTYLQFVLGIYKGIFNAIATLWNNTIGKLSFKVPSWVPGIGGKGFDVPNIPMLAEGGIVTQPTLALIGERGAEAVIPLDKMNNGGNIYVTVQGGDPNAIVDALRRYQRQNGAVPIRTVA